MHTRYRWLSIVIMLITLSGCSQYVDGTVLPTISILERDDQAAIGAGDDYFNDKEPALMLVSSIQEQNELLKFILKKDKEIIQGMRPEYFILIAVFDGERFNSGYYVSITKAIKQPGHLYIYAQFVKPKPQQLLELSGPRSAFSIVSVERSAFAANERLTVHLLDDATKQEVLAQEYTVQ